LGLSFLAFSSTCAAAVDHHSSWSEDDGFAWLAFQTSFHKKTQGK
jgi:hypothetical protein